MSDFVPDEFGAPLLLSGDEFFLEPLGPEHNERDYTGVGVEHRAHPGDSWIRGLVLAP
jgi:hypothetical protein